MEYSKGKTLATVIRQEEVAEGIMSMWVLPDEKLPSPASGMFYEIYPEDGAHLLGRPISLCDYDAVSGIIRFLYQVKGFGTNQMSLLSSGDKISLMGPLGNGFPRVRYGTKPLLIGGGMGIAPLLYLTKRLNGNCRVILGFKDNPILVNEYIGTGAEIILAIENGAKSSDETEGINKTIRGTVIDALKEEDTTGTVIYSCGPLPMLKALSQYAESQKIETYVSLEERMGCGIGVCLGCVTEDRKCVCKDGPVFNSSEVRL